MATAFTSLSTTFLDVLSHHHLGILAAACLSFFLVSLFRSSSIVPHNWPVLGMVPGLAANFPNLHEYVTAIVRASGLSFYFKGPWLLKMDFLIACDPADMNHIFNTNFPNYVKGEKFSEIFDVLGDGLFGADGESWRLQRKMAQSIFVEADLRSVHAGLMRDKVEAALTPLLDHMASDGGRSFDMFDAFVRLTFDFACETVLGFDLCSLSVDFPSVPFADAIDAVEEAVLLRQVLPPSVWKTMRWLNVGSEKKLALARRQVDSFILDQIAKLREKKNSYTGANYCPYDLVSLHMKRGMDDDKFLRDSALTFMIGGRDTISLTLSWFVYSVLTNPHVEQKTLNELKTIVHDQGHKRGREALVFDANMAQPAVYLHAALCETLRLYPPLPFDTKEALKADVLPSGVTVAAGTKIIFPIYSMGRIESIWGDDCYEFRPERWITEKGELRREPSYKFFAFICGPRTCLGRDPAFVQMKIVAATLIYNYHVKLVEGQAVAPKKSAALVMENGMLVKVTKRSY